MNGNAVFLLVIPIKTIERRYGGALTTITLCLMCATRVVAQEPTAPSLPAKAKAPAIGRVVEVSASEVVITLGRAEQLQRGSHVELFERRVDALVGGERAVREESFAVGEVTVV